MSKIAGRLQTLRIDNGGGLVSVLGVVDATLNGEVGEIDTTCHDATSRTYIPERFSGTIDGTLRWDDADLGQEDMKAAFLAKSEDGYEIRMETGTGFDEYTAQGFITSFAPTGPNDDVADWSFTIRLTGDLTRATQP